MNRARGKNPSSPGKRNPGAQGRPSLSFLFLFIGPVLLFAAGAPFLFSGCGGGGGGGGGGISPQEPHGGAGDIVLTGITFPEWTNLTGGGSTPPVGAPLSQQVVFTFSGEPACPDKVVIDVPPGYGALQIYAILTSDYSGPEVVADYDRNIIPARGTYEKFGNEIVFTPSFPTREICFRSNAAKESVPGLLPDMEYIVYVPVGSGGAISNLRGVDKAVTNPVKFTTITEALPNFFFKNQPADPPQVTDQYPRDGEQDVAINTFEENLPGFPPVKDFFVEFDQPLSSSDANVEGSDLDGDGVAEENIYFLSVPRRYFAALDTGTSLDPGLFEVDREKGTATLVGITREASPPGYPVTGLNSILNDGSGGMIGSSGAALYQVDFRNPQQGNVLLTKKADFAGRTAVRGLSRFPDGTLYAVDASTGELVTIDPGTGDITTILQLGSASGLWEDTAVGPDGRLYALAVSDSGSPNAWTTIQLVDLAVLEPSAVTLYSGAGDYTSICMAGYARLSLYSRQGLFVDLYDIPSGQFIASEHYEIQGGGLEEGSFLNIDDDPAELGTWVEIAENTWHGSRVSVKPSGILPFGGRVQLLVRRGLSNVSLGSLAGEQGCSPALADLLGTFTTFDYGAGVEDLFYEDFLDTEWEGEPILETPSLPPAIWNIRDVDGEPPEYKHLLATYGLGGGGVLGDFKPLGIYPIVVLDTDYQTLPLFDGSTPGVRKQTVVKGGIFNFRDIVIPEGVTVIGRGSNPLVLTATGTIVIEGTIDVSGSDGMSDVTYNSAFVPVPGGKGGPGGGKGGVSQPPTPPDFQKLTDLRSPHAGERGWGPSNRKQIGGYGGECCAKGTDVKYKGGGGGSDAGSRGSGGGGGSFFQKGGMGYHGLGMWGADPYSPDRYYIRDEWEFNDGAPPDMPNYNLVPHVYMTQDGPGGPPGEWPFADGDPDNDFIGDEGEVKHIQGGQGGGGGGSRLDSLNPATIGLAQGWWPPVDRSAYDARGGGGGGGGGAVALYALGGITIRSTGAILARGGQGGGGECIGQSNYGGGAGGGSGGAIILDSADSIHIEAGGLVDVSGGWMGDAKEATKYGATVIEGNPCRNLSLHGGFEDYHRSSFCNFSYGDGGYGGYGIIQLEVPDSEEDLDVEDWQSVCAQVCIIDWYDSDNGLCDFNLSQPHCGCKASGHCLQRFYHYKINYPQANEPEFPLLYPDPQSGEWGPCADPKKTPTTLGPVSYGLSKWIDLGCAVERDPVSGVPAPRFLDFRGIDKVTGEAITINGYIPDPEDIDFSVSAPDWNNGTLDYIPEENDVAILFQGANPVAPGSKVPDPATMTDWTGDITQLCGMQFVRFRIRLDTAKDHPLTPSSPKPQINFLRIRMQY